MINWLEYGFALKKETPLSELDATVYQLVHEKTGLELVWMKRDEENKTFAISFETLPWNDTGVFHILEHSVLCGSKNYPIKDPFVELLKSSMNTFLNAFTFPDKTLYPVSSRNDRDFANLVRVYLDAVFQPMIYSKPEIFYQEGWHYETDEDGNIGYKGVVFNEMKGAFADADELINTGLSRCLFPDSPYRFVSGGDPATIPDLTYDEFISAHKRHYSPSNAYVFLDGDVDIAQVLSILNNEYLAGFEKSERCAPPTMQAAVSAQCEDVYEISPEEDAQGRTRLSYGKVIGTFAEREKLIAAEILCEALCGSNQSPLTQVVLSRGLAEEVNMSLNDGVLQPWMVLDVKNLKEEDLAETEKVITEELERLAANGLDHTQLEAVMANLEFKLRERDFGGYPQGIIFAFNVMESWLYGGDPTANLEVGDLFVKLREKLSQGYFESLIREMLLDNPHSAKIVLRPSHSAGEQRRQAEQARIEREAALWSEKDKLAVEKQQEALLSWQETEDSPEDCASIPQLSLEDIPSGPEDIPTELMHIGNTPVIYHALHTSGIAYINLYFDADHLTPDELSCLSLACGLLGESDTANASAGRIIDRVRLLCGSFEVHPDAYTVDGDAKTAAVKMCVSFSALEKNVREATELVAQILTGSIFNDETTHDILRQTVMELFQNTVMSGSSVALTRIMAQISSAGVVKDHVGGISFYQWLKKTDENWSFAELKTEMDRILSSVLNRNAMTVSVSGLETADEIVDILEKAIPASPVAAKTEIQPWGKRAEGITIPADISFAVQGGNICAHGGKYCGQMALAGQVISLAYLWNMIRMQGGAYGTGMVAKNSGFVACYSYRDPNGAASLECYPTCGQFLREVAQSGMDLTGFIIGTVAATSPLMTPRTKVRTGDGFYLSNISYQQRCENHRQLCNATADDLLEIADWVESTLSDAGICIVGGQEQLNNCPQLDSVITL